MWAGKPGGWRGTSKERETDGAHAVSHLPLVNRQSLTDTLGEAGAKRGPWRHPSPTSVPLGEFSAPLWAETPSLYKETIIQSLIYLFEFYFHSYFSSAYYVPGTV